MTAIGVTDRTGRYNRTTEAHDWKRRAERLVRASGLPYTIVRPGWFDYNRPDQLRLVLLQGDTRHAGDPNDGVVARRRNRRDPRAQPGLGGGRPQDIRVGCRTWTGAQGVRGLRGAVRRSGGGPTGALDAVRDAPNMPLNQEPERVRGPRAAHGPGERRVAPAAARRPAPFRYTGKRRRPRRQGKPRAVARASPMQGVTMPQRHCRHRSGSDRPSHRAAGRGRASTSCWPTCGRRTPRRRRRCWRTPDTR